MKNTGKPSENDFCNLLTGLYGIDCHIIRFQDAAALHGLNGHAVKTDKQPSDFLVVVRSKMFLAEVKSTNNLTSFPFSLIKPNQLKHAKLTHLAGGKYYFFIQNLNTKKFYVMTYEEYARCGKQSLKWSEMREWNGSINLP